MRGEDAIRGGGANVEPGFRGEIGTEEDRVGYRCDIIDETKGNGDKE